MRRTIVVVCSIVATLACASTGNTGSTGISGNPRITAEEVAAANLPTAYDVVERLRRAWLRRDALTGGEVSVYMEERSLGGAEKLREIPAVEVRTLELVPNEQATLRWGSSVKGSVILITRRY